MITGHGVHVARRSGAVGMNRTKWVRLIVRDLGDVVRWANSQQARHIGEFRYRLINGRESVSFRLYPDYAIQIGTRDIVVVCHVNTHRWRRMAWRLLREVVNAGAATARRVLPGPTPAIAGEVAMHSAEVRAFSALRQPAPAHS
jgi:hypothetical protein